MAAPPARVTIRVVVQSSRRLLRDTLSACLAIRPDITVVGKVAEADSVVALCELRQPDVVILDAGPRLGEFAALVGELRRGFPELNVIVSYRTATEQDLAAACRAGVTSLVPESHGLAALLTLLRPRKARHARTTPGSLTDREVQIVVLTGSGHSVSEIATLLESARSRSRTSSAASSRSWTSTAARMQYPGRRRSGCWTAARARPAGCGRTTTKTPWS